VYGPWRYLTGHIAGTAAAPAPENAPKQHAETHVAGTYVYPNPASSAFSIQTHTHGKIRQSELLTAGGKTVRSWQNPSGSLNIKGIPPGKYILRVTYSDLTESSHFVMLH
jgi:hypothetical protein